MNRTGGGRSAKETVVRAWEWLVGFVRELDRSRTTGMAAELAFWLFLALIPLAAVAGLVLARIAVASEHPPELLASLPPETRDLIKDQLATVAAWNGGRVAAPAALVFLWLAAGGIASILEVLETKAGARRPWWRRRLIAIAMCAGLSVGFALVALLVTGLDRIGAMLKGVLPWELNAPSESALDTAGRLAVGFGTAVALVYGLFLFGVPRKARKRRVILPGALLAVGLGALLSYGYVFYLGQVGTHSAYQAGLSIIGVTMIALYLLSLALLVGAELNYVLDQGTPHRAEKR
jgi:membrane protein